MRDFFKIITYFFFVSYPLGIALVVGSSCAIASENYTSVFPSGLQLSYKHWNIVQQKITGFSHFRYENTLLNQQQVLRELNQNVDIDSKIFIEKTIIFEAQSGKILSSYEHDLRSDLTITNQYQQQDILSVLTQKEKTQTLTLRIEEPIVPFEMLSFFLRKNFSTIQQRETTSFLVYLPAIAFELEKQGLPSSLSQLRMQIDMVETLSIQTALGEKNAVRLRIRPQSFLLRSLLPKEKSEFFFLVDRSFPHYILRIEEANLHYILESVTMITP